MRCIVCNYCPETDGPGPDIQIIKDEPICNDCHQTIQDAILEYDLADDDPVKQRQTERKVMKPFKGHLKNWKEKKTLNGEIYLVGRFDGHPLFHGSFGHTSKVISHNKETGEVETLNSKYLAKPEDEYSYGE